MLLIKSATKGLGLILGFGRSFAIPPLRGWHELDRLRLRLTPLPGSLRPAVGARCGLRAS